MKILCSGDKHIGLVSDGMDRIEEHERILDDIIEILYQYKPDIYVDLGDLFNSSRPNPKHFEVAFKYLNSLDKWSKSCKGSWYLIAGNHDKPTNGYINSLLPFKLNFKHNIFILPKHISLMNHTRISKFTNTDLLFLPYITDWEVRNIFKKDFNAKKFLKFFVNKVLNEIDGRNLIAFTHLEVPGSKMSNNETLQRDVGLSIPKQLIKYDKLVKIYSGHIHKYQEIGKIIVVGSSLYVDFGESLDKKGLIYSEL